MADTCRPSVLSISKVSEGICLAVNLGGIDFRYLLFYMYVLCSFAQGPLLYYFLSKSPSDHIRKKESRTGGKKEQSVLRSLRKQRKTSFAIRNRRRHSIAAALLGSMIANKNKLMQFTLLSKAITRDHGDSKWNAKTQLSTISHLTLTFLRFQGLRL